MLELKINKVLLQLLLLSFSGHLWASSDISCMLEPSMDIKLGFPVDGVLDNVSVDRGDIVEKGQLLARLYSGVEQATVDYHSAKAAFGSRKRDRTEELQKNALISKQEHDEISTDQKLAEMELKEKREYLKLRSVFSPVRGVVVDRFFNPGDLIHQGHVLRVAQLDPLYVELVLPVSWWGKFKLDQKYSVSVASLNRTFPAKVRAIDKVVDAASSTFRIRMEAENKLLDIPSGLRCEIDLKN